MSNEHQKAAPQPALVVEGKLANSERMKQQSNYFYEALSKTISKTA